MHLRSEHFEKPLMVRRGRPRTGLALSSGAARGLAHIGVLQVLEELDIRIDAVAGCSMGAYIGSLWNYGCDGKRLEQLAATVNRAPDLLRLIDPAFPPGRGLIRGAKIKRRLKATLGGTRFSELRRPLRVVATRLDTFERAVFSRGIVVDAVHASLAIPGVCVPVELDGHRYSDGAILDPLPVDVLRGIGCETVIAVSVIPPVSEIIAECGNNVPSRGFLQDFNPFASGNFVDTLRRSVLSAEIRLAHESANEADVLIAPRVGNHGWHDYRQWPYYIDEGRTATLAKKKELLAIKRETFSVPNIATNNHYETITT